MPLLSYGQLDQFEIEFPWKHHVSRMEPDSTGYYWLHDDKDFFYYNGHQVTAAGLGDILGKKKNEYFFSGDLIRYQGSLVFINQNTISLFDPINRSITPQWDLPEGDLFNHLYQDDLGRIWIFTSNPDTVKRSVYRADKGLDFKFAFDLYPFFKGQGLFWDYELSDRNGLLFLHRRLGGLLILDENGAEIQAPVQNLADFESKRACSQFRLDNNNNLWKIYNDQFEILDWATGRFRPHGLTGQFEFITNCKKEIEVTNLQRGLKGFGSLLNLRSIYMDSKDRVWLSCATSYLVMYDPVIDDVLGFRTPIVKELEGGDHDVMDIFEDPEGNIWGKQKGGLFKIRDKESYFRSYAVNTSDVDHPLYKSEDQATIKQSINHYNDYAIRNSAIHGIGEDQDGNVIFQEGVFTYQLNLISEEIKVLPLFNPKEKVHLTVEGDLKIYASWNSYYRFDKNFKVSKLDLEVIKLENVYKQRNGNIWLSGILEQPKYMFGLADTVTLEYQGNFIDPTGQIDFSTIPVKGMSEDETGLLWIATSNGIYTLDSNNMQVEKWEDTFSYEGEPYKIGAVNQFLHFKGNLFWFKSDNEFGLINVDEKRIIHLKTIDYERSGTQLKILPINDHSIWVGDQRGLSYIDFSENINIILSLEEGIDTKGAVNVLRELKSGLIAIGTNNGFYTCNPQYVLSKSKIRENKDLNVPIFVNGYSYVSSQSDEKANHRFLAQSDLNIALDHDHRDLSVNVSIKDFDHPNRHIYSHRLVGFDTDWSDRTSENIINYTSLPPGNYQLQVRGSQSGGVWSNQILNIDISVAGIWYRAWWFLALVLFGLSGTVYLVTNYYQGQKLKRQIAISEIRERISKDLHDDVGTLMVGVAMQSEVLEAAVAEKNKGFAKQIALSSREAMSRMRDTVWAIDSRRDGVIDLKDRMMDFIGEIVNPDRFKYSFEDADMNQKLKLPPDIRQAAFLIFKESVANIVKHSDGRRFNTELSTKKDHLQLIIKDDGSEQDKINTSGQGLSNMKSRAEALNGSYTFSYDQGYQTILELPL